MHIQNVIGKLKKNKYSSEMLNSYLPESKLLQSVTLPAETALVNNNRNADNHQISFIVLPYENAKNKFNKKSNNHVCKANI